MNMTTTIAPQEIIGINGLVSFKNLCATKAATMAPVAKDEELKSMLEQDLTATQGHIKELQQLLQGANFNM